MRWNWHETESFIKIRKSDIGKCGPPANITRKKKQTRKANLKYNYTNKTSQFRTFMLKFHLLRKL